MNNAQRQLQALSIVLMTNFFSACSSNPNSIDTSQSQQPTNINPNEKSSSEDSQTKPADIPNQAPKHSCSKAPLKPQTTLNVQYKTTQGVDANLQSLDIYMPEVAEPCSGIPVVVWVHGGAWMIGDKSQIGFKAQHFNSLGYGFVSINYRLSPNLIENSELILNRIQFPDHPSDVGAAVGWIGANIENYGGNPNQVALLGHSAGAHLAALVALDQSYITAANPAWNPKSLRCVGSYDTEAYNVNSAVDTAADQQLRIYRNAFGFSPAILTKASPLSHVKEFAPPFQLALRGDAQRRQILQEFKSTLESQKNTADVINAETLSHEEVNRVIGNPTDQIMTPAITQFVQTTCFGQ